jgi:hypothetical protein
MNIGLYDDLVSRDLPLRELVFRMLEAIRKRGITALFLRVVLEARPTREDLREAIARHYPEALETQPRFEEQARSLAAGVETLQTQLTTPAVRAVVTQSRDKLEQLIEDADILANYKALHDSLHVIQLTQYPQVADNVKRLRSEPLAAATLEDHVHQLRYICSDARNAAEALPNTAAVRAQELQWVTTIQSAIAELSKAIDNLDDQSAARAVRSIRQVIRQEPFRINTLLTLTAQKLPLEDLLRTIEMVAEAVSGGALPMRELRNALQSVRNILPQLRGRVAEHNQWQDVENEFWGADEFLERGTPESIVEFNLLWPAAKSKVESLARTEPEAEWAKASAKLAGLIDANIAGQIELARINFRRFRHAVLFHFCQVDKALRSQCQAILEIRAPLRSLLNEV